MKVIFSTNFRPKTKKIVRLFWEKYRSVWFWANLETFSRISPNCVTNQPSNYYQQHRFCRTWLTPVQKMIRNKLWIIKSRGFKIKNKILPYDLVIFQTSWCYCLEFILNFRIFIMLILSDFKPMLHFYIPWKYQKVLDFWCLRGLEMELTVS